ncbi:hypothetical protein FACS1894107_13130 [Planctomycetales bacterium]|nr:hypothetical protein FACS1894107_13130 [Planctomycetales bacterium]
MPLDIFPSEWFAKTDGNKLTAFIDGVKSRLRNQLLPRFDASEKNAADLDELKRKLSAELNTALTDPQLFAVLNGGEALAPKKTQLLISHLNTLLPEIRLANPFTVSENLPPVKIGVAAAVGSFGGIVIGGAVSALCRMPPETGHLFGAVCGAFIAVIGGLRIASEPRLRKWAMGIVGTVGALDIIRAMFKPALFPTWLPSWVPPIGGKKLSFGKRLAFYASALIALSFLKVERTVNVQQFETDLAGAVEQYIRAVLPLIAVLMFKTQIDAKDGVKTGDEKILHKIIPIIQRAQLRDADDIDELLQELKLGGYAFTEAAPKELVWEKSLEKQYETFGLIDDGTVCVIARLPIVKNDEVIARGLVRRKRGVE